MAEEIKNNKIEGEPEKLVEEILKQLRYKARCSVTENKDGFLVNITGENLGLLIGARGKNLESLQLILAIALNKGRKDWVPVNVDIGGWRKEKEEAIRRMVQDNLAEIEEKGEVQLPPMPPSQRRIVHLIVSEIDNLQSESIGEEPYRRVVIRKKK